MTVSRSLPGRLPQTSAELLEPENLRLRGPQHHHRVERRQVDAFVEHVHAKDDVQVAGGQALEGCGSRRRRGAGVDGYGSDTAPLKKSAMKSACRCETQNPSARRAALFRNCSSAFSARRWVATAVVSASSSNRVLLHGMFV